MEEVPENGKESSHSAHANGMNECIHFVLVSLSKKNILRSWKKVSWVLQIMVLETGCCLSAFVFLNPTLVYINQRLSSKSDDSSVDVMTFKIINL
jgi:hypothetical protein